MRKCVICGRGLPYRQIKYCSEECRQTAALQRKEGTDIQPIVADNGYYKCHECGRMYNHGNDLLFCSSFCRKAYNSDDHEEEVKPTASELERPYTKDTPMIVYNWRKGGDSWRLIAQILRRSVDNVKRTYDIYAEQIGEKR